MLLKLIPDVRQFGRGSVFNFATFCSARYHGSLEPYFWLDPAKRVEKELDVDDNDAVVSVVLADKGHSLGTRMCRVPNLKNHAKGRRCC